MITSRKPRLNPQIVSEVDKVLRKELSDYNYQGADIEPGLDHDGDPVLFIDVRYLRSDVPVTAESLIRVLRDVIEVLGQLGEERFPHIRHHFDERQEVADRR